MKKTLIVLLEIFLLGIILLLGANIYYSKPKNCLSCHEISNSYNSWKASSHNSVNCNECHEERGLIGSVKSKARGIFRVILHFTGIEASAIRAVVVKEQCWQCHTQLRKKFRLGSIASLSDTHSIHINKGYSCTDCHLDAVHPKSLKDSGSPKMETCISCHKANKIPTDCNTCHIDVERHQRIIAQLGGLSLEKQKDGCYICHPPLNGDFSQVDHKQAIENAGGWKGDNSLCSKCHPQANDDMSYAVHAKLKAPVHNVKGVSGEQGFLTRSSVLYGSDAVLNWAYIINKGEETVSQGCGKCHTGDSPPTGSRRVSEVDCLICHSQTYDMSKRVIVQTEEGLKWSWDRSKEAAYSVGPPSSDACKRCHEEYLSLLRGTPFTEKDYKDAHASKGMACIQCHTSKNHKIARGSFVTDLWANDLPNVAHSCIQCHMNRRHENNFINLHLKKIACETCHVKSADGIVTLDWTKPVRKNGIYNAHRTWKEQGLPVFEWFNGLVEKSTKPVGKKGDGKAKIFPFKVIKSVLPYDPDNNKFLPMKLSIFAQTGDVRASIEAAVRESDQSWSGKWEKMTAYTYLQISHSVSNKGRECSECHGKNGIMNFDTLGYSHEEKESLQKEK